MIQLTDSHIHLSHASEHVILKVVGTAINNGVHSFLCPGVSINEYADNCLFAEKIRRTFKEICPDLRIFTGIGIHPMNANDYKEENLLREIDRHGASVSYIGEIGLDKRFYNEVPFEVQRDVFVSQVLVAKRFDFPIHIHCVGAHADLIKILKDLEFSNNKVNGVIHAYSGSEQEAKEYAKLGFLIGCGSGLFNGSKKLRKTIESLGANSLVLETDFPYMYIAADNEDGQLSLNNYQGTNIDTDVRNTDITLGEENNRRLMLPSDISDSLDKIVDIIATKTNALEETRAHVGFLESNIAKHNYKEILLNDLAKNVAYLHR